MPHEALGHLPDNKRRELERVARILFDEFEDAQKNQALRQVQERPHPHRRHLGAARQGRCPVLAGTVGESMAMIEETTDIMDTLAFTSV
ncbi:hypothetical protein ACFPLB_14485 [Aquamicrobium segne]|uniref:Uncharacterized protein n=1 Tax=Aquamicrobium segne TaxID=469547 RepID=A0ABW0H1Z3_9HYPH